MSFGPHHARQLVTGWWRRFHPRPTDRQPYRELAQLIASYASPGSAPKVLYLGDSVLERVAHQDTNRRPLAAMMAAEVESRDGTTFSTLAHSAYNPAIQLEMLRCLARLPAHPDIILLHLNLRCFSPQWDLHPLWQFDDETTALRRFAHNPKRGAGQVRVLKNSPDLYPRYDATPVCYPESSCKTLGEFRALSLTHPSDEERQLRRWRELFIFHYLHRLEKEHRKAVQLGQLLALCRKMSLRVLTYITPINWEAGTRLVGARFDEVVTGNIAVLEAVISRHAGGGVEHLNLSRQSPSAHFFHDNDPTEHLNEEGRRTLVGILAPVVMGLARAESRSVLSH